MWPEVDRLALLSTHPPAQHPTFRTLTAALLAVHDLPVGDCPFDSTPDALLPDVARRLPGNEAHRIWDAGRRTWRSASDVYEELEAERPAALREVVVHGDASVPNVIVRDGALAGIVDVGLLGRGDPWWDLTACLNSMAREDNDLGSVQEEFMQAYGCDRDPGRERWHGLLYRLVFDLPAGRARQ